MLEAIRNDEELLRLQREVENFLNGDISQTKSSWNSDGEYLFALGREVISRYLQADESLSTLLDASAGTIGHFQLDYMPRRVAALDRIDLHRLRSEPIYAAAEALDFKTRFSEMNHLFVVAGQLQNSAMLHSPHRLARERAANGAAARLATWKEELGYPFELGWTLRKRIAAATRDPLGALDSQPRRDRQSWSAGIQQFSTRRGQRS
jgi:hypothetical protein